MRSRWGDIGLVIFLCVLMDHRLSITTPKKTWPIFSYLDLDLPECRLDALTTELWRNSIFWVNRLDNASFISLYPSHHFTGYYILLYCVVGSGHHMLNTFLDENMTCNNWNIFWFPVYWVFRMFNFHVRWCDTREKCLDLVWFLFEISVFKIVMLTAVWYIHWFVALWCKQPPLWKNPGSAPA